MFPVGSHLQLSDPGYQSPGEVPWEPLMVIRTPDYNGQLLHLVQEDLDGLSLVPNEVQEAHVSPGDKGSFWEIVFWVISALYGLSYLVTHLRGPVLIFLAI